MWYLDSLYYNGNKIDRNISAGVRIDNKYNSFSYCDNSHFVAILSDEDLYMLKFFNPDSREYIDIDFKSVRQFLLDNQVWHFNNNGVIELYAYNKFTHWFQGSIEYDDCMDVASLLQLIRCGDKYEIADNYLHIDGFVVRLLIPKDEFMLKITKYLLMEG